MIRWLYLNVILPLATRWMVNMEPPKRRVCMDVGACLEPSAFCDGERYDATCVDDWKSVTCKVCLERRGDARSLLSKLPRDLS